MFRQLIVATILAMPAISLAQQATRPAITGISHVTLYADDIAKSEQFYTGLLGWRQVPSNSTATGVRCYANHAQYVELVAPPAPKVADRLAGVAFSTSDAEALRKYIGSRGVAVPASVAVEADGSRTFQVLDPEGNKVSFTQLTDHPLAASPSASSAVSSHIMHAGYVVHNRAALDHFYKDMLGFHLYWQGGNPSTRVDWVMMQVPDGTDWIEYMLYLPANPSLEQLGSANHLAPGVASVAELQTLSEVVMKRL